MSRGDSLSPNDFATRRGWVEADIRRRLVDGEWTTGARLPTEQALTVEYGVSRATVRSAMSGLETLGLVRSQQGSGTFAVASSQAVRGDLRFLDSMSATIERNGMTATSEFRPAVTRQATDEEQTRLDVAEGEELLCTAREIRADGSLVAYSSEIVPLGLLGDFDPEEGIGTSMLKFLDGHGIGPMVAEAELHASVDHPDFEGSDAGSLYLRLDQLHRDGGGRPVMWSSSYFLEGRFTFGLLRIR